LVAAIWGLACRRLPIILSIHEIIVSNKPVTLNLIAVKNASPKELLLPSFAARSRAAVRDNPVYRGAMIRLIGGSCPRAFTGSSPTIAP
jgi:hypothetical protein